MRVHVCVRACVRACEHAGGRAGVCVSGWPGDSSTDRATIAKAIRLVV